MRPEHGGAHCASLALWTLVGDRHAPSAVGFSDRPVDDAQIERIFHAGGRTHSSKNLQRWTFTVVRDRYTAGPIVGKIE
jgi:nitroreductase